MFKKILNSKKEKTKVVKIVTEQSEHVCTEECFKPRKKVKPRGLRKIELGYIYQDNRGRFYKEWGDDDWLEVVGMTFMVGAGGYHLVFEPKKQLHIHSPGGRTIAQTTEQRDTRVNEEFHVIEAAKKLKRKKYNLRKAQEFLDSKAAEVIPKAPKSKKPIKGTGRGARGVPRTELGKEVVRLIKDGKSKKQVLDASINWSKNNAIAVAGPYKNKIKKQVNYWWAKIKSAHK